MYGLDSPPLLPLVFLSVTSHMFVSVHNEKLYEEYYISYLTIFDLFEGKYNLHSVSDNIYYSLLTEIFDLQMSNQAMYCITTKSAILQYNENMSMTNEEKLCLISHIYVTGNVRFMQL